MSTTMDRLRIRADLSTNEMTELTTAMTRWRQAIYPKSSMKPTQGDDLPANAAILLSQSDLIRDSRMLPSHLQQLLDLQRDSVMLGMQAMLQEMSFDSDKLGREILFKTHQIKGWSQELAVMFRDFTTDVIRHFPDLTDHEQIVQLTEIADQCSVVADGARKLRTKFLQVWPLCEPTPELIAQSRTELREGNVVSVEDMIAEQL